MLKIKVFAHTSPESMIEKGKEAGLSEKAANYFRHFDEIELELEVRQDGQVTRIASVNGFAVESPVRK